jgi:HTH-type transcriptional repressor of NAD biosynthesis genes
MRTYEEENGRAARTGMFGGSFDPPHLGHVRDIAEAGTMCDKLYVVLWHSELTDSIDYRLRWRWLKRLTEGMDFVEVIRIEDNISEKSSHDWEKGRDKTLAAIGRPVDIVFHGDDYPSDWFKRLYPDADIHSFSRETVPIASTNIKENPMACWEYIPNIVKPYYVKKVIIIGTESSGKSVLTKNLANVWNTSYVREIGRDVSAEAGGVETMTPEDYEKILITHKAEEYRALQAANKILFVDTDASVTMCWLHATLGICPETSSAFSLGKDIQMTNRDSIYIFLEPDVKWVQDGTRVFGDEKARMEHHERLKEYVRPMLDNSKCFFVGGDYNERYRKVMDIVTRYIGE